MDSCGSAIVCPNLEGAIAYFCTHPGRILSTVGSKELPALTQIEDYQKRIVARILPLPEAVQASTQLGFQGKNLICMQGPFSYEMNLATLKDYDCQYLLTKNTGRAGGLLEKLEAAETANAQTVLIDRPKQESGISVKEAFEMICSQMMEDL